MPKQSMKAGESNLKYTYSEYRLRSKTIYPFLNLLFATIFSFLIVSHSVNSEASPRLSGHFTEIAEQVVDSRYSSVGLSRTITIDINSDGHQDFIVLGLDFPDYEGDTTYSPQPSRVLLGDGQGGFVVAPSELFPVDTLNTVHPSNSIVFADFNEDGRPDMFVPCSGWGRSLARRAEQATTLS